MTLRNKILMLGFVAILGMFFAQWLQYRSYATQAQAIETVTRNVTEVGALSQATHELQKERGLTTIMQFSAGNQALVEQIRRTDESLARLAATRIRVAGLDGSLVRLRAMAASDSAALLTVRDGYTGLLQNLFDEMGRLTYEPEASVPRVDVTAHGHLMKAKEYLGQTRVTLGYGIGLRRDDPTVISGLIRLKSLYDEEMRMLELAPSPELQAAAAAQLSGNDIAQTLRVVTQIAATGELPKELDVQTWWSLATAAIDRLKHVEDHSLGLIEQKAEDKLTRSRNAMHLGVIITLGVGLAAFILALSTTATLIRALDRALASIEHISITRNFRSRLPVQSPDEIGRISMSFNRLLDVAEKLLNEKDYLATTDTLTGIHNRMKFVKVLDEEADRKRRNKMPMSLIIFDVDHFKDINDEHGHNIGDEVLKALANLVSKETRSTDFFCRWGGDEFILLLKDDGCDAAIIAAEKIRNLVEATDFPTIGKVTCSFGVAAWKENDTEEKLVVRADKALYDSKSKGRNQVRCPEGDWKTCCGRAQCSQFGSTDSVGAANT